MSGLDPYDARDKAEQAMLRVGGKDFLNKLTSDYSKGMRQRTKIAQAIVHEPDLLILDEPLSGTDPIGRREIMDLVIGLGQEGRSILVSSHVMHEVQAMTSEFLLIYGGRVLASGNVREIRALMNEYPHRITIRSDRARDLAERMMRDLPVQGVQIGEKGEQLSVLTQDPGAFYEALPGVVEASGGHRDGDAVPRREPRRRVRLPGERAMKAVFDLQVRQILGGGKKWIVALFLSLPLLLLTVVAISGGFDAPGASDDVVGFITLVFLFILYPQTTCILATLLYGASMLSVEIEGKTVTYLFTRPVARWKVLVAKYLGIVTCLSVLVTPIVTVAWLIAGLPEGFRGYVALLIATLGAVVTYSAFFTALGILIPEALDRRGADLRRGVRGAAVGRARRGEHAHDQLLPALPGLPHRRRARDRGHPAGGDARHRRGVRAGLPARPGRHDRALPGRQLLDRHLEGVPGLRRGVSPPYSGSEKSSSTLGASSRASS